MGCTSFVRGLLGLGYLSAALLVPRLVSAQQCVPECRQGYVCAAGTCVSACNPPCAAGETCAEGGQCVATAPAQPAEPVQPVQQPPAEPQPAEPQPAQAQPAQAQPVQAQPGYAQPADEPWTPAPADQDPAGEIRTVSFVPRLMLAPFGSGTLECEGDGCISNDGIDYDHKSAFGFGADVMFRVGSVIRLGPGLAYMAEHDIEFEDASDEYTVGSDFTLSFVLDAAIPVSPTVWLVPRGQVGLLLLFPGGDLRDDLDDLQVQCEAAGISGCDSLEGARPGVQGGLGFGVMFAVSPSVRLRADAMYQFYSVNVYTLEGPGVDAAVNFNGGRGFLMAGAEF